MRRIYGFCYARPTSIASVTNLSCKEYGAQGDAVYGGPTDRFSVSLEAILANAFDDLIKQAGIRDTRRGRARYPALSLAGESRALAERLATVGHSHHDLTISVMRAHLDYEQCVETVMLKGSVSPVRQIEQELITEPGMQYGHLETTQDNSPKASALLLPRHARQLSKHTNPSAMLLHQHVGANFIGFKFDAFI
jgi:CopG family transcriptional regulator, nickel-responsive regulator